MSAPVIVTMYADLGCPFTYLAAFKLRRLRAERAFVVAHTCLALEYVNREPTPRRLLALETPLALLGEPDIPYVPWSAPDSDWPVTFWPAFEALKCAERQSLELADELAWAIRVAFFAEQRCVALRHVLLELAERVGLDLARFMDDFDSGAAKRQVIEEAREGWERLRLPGSPTFVLPDGAQVSDLGLPDAQLDGNERDGYRLTAYTPGASNDDAFRRLLDAAGA